MPELPTPVVIHKTRLLGSEGRSEIQLFAGRTKDRSSYAVWMEAEGPGGKSLRPVVFTSSPEEVAVKYNQKLEDLAAEGYPTSSEKMLDTEFIAEHVG